MKSGACKHCAYHFSLEAKTTLRRTLKTINCPAIPRLRAACSRHTSPPSAYAKKRDLRKSPEICGNDEGENGEVFGGPETRKPRVIRALEVAEA
jgi:hypothetical protein